MIWAFRTCSLRIHSNLMRKKLRESRLPLLIAQLTISERPRVERGARAGLAPARAHLLVVVVVQRRHGGMVLHGGAGQRNRHDHYSNSNSVTVSLMQNWIAGCFKHSPTEEMKST